MTRIVDPVLGDLRQKLLQRPGDYIQSIAGALEEAGISEEVIPIVTIRPAPTLRTSIVGRWSKRTLVVAATSTSGSNGVNVSSGVAMGTSPSSRTASGRAVT